MRKAALFAVPFALASIPALAGQGPSHDFALRSLNALTSMPTVSAARWMELGRRRPAAVLRAIASAEKKGWQPTSTTVLFSKGAANRNVRPVAAQDLYQASGDGEMLVWNWDDGDPNTAEGTVWVHSYVTGNEVTFNVQWTGETYDTSDITFYEGVDAVATSSWVVGTAALAPPGMPGARALRVQVQNVGQCEAKGEATGAACLMRAAKDHLRDGVRGAATGAVVGGVAGAWAAGLAGGIAGAIGGVLPGFATGVLGSLIWGADHACLDEARQVYQDCIEWLQECSRHTKADCGLVAVTSWKPNQ